MTTPTHFQSIFTDRRADILACPALTHLALSLHDPIAFALHPGADVGMTDAQRALAAEMAASHAQHGDADPGFVAFAGALAVAVRNAEAEYGPSNED